MRILALCITLGLTSLSSQAGKENPPNYDYQDGDILLYSGAGPQAQAIKEATGSPFTHCGVIFQNEGKWWVFEAVQPIRCTPLEQFKGRNIDQYRALRLKDPVDPAVAERLVEWMKAQLGKPYDVKFRWGNDMLYCSELVWKLYAVGGVELCKKRAFKDYNLKAPAVARMIRERYGAEENLPLDEPVVAPSDIANSKLLIEAPRVGMDRKR